MILHFFHRFCVEGLRGCLKDICRKCQDCSQFVLKNLVFKQHNLLAVSGGAGGFRNSPRGLQDTFPLILAPPRLHGAESWTKTICENSVFRLRQIEWKLIDAYVLLLAHLSTGLSSCWFVIGALVDDLHIRELRTRIFGRICWGMFGRSLEEFWMCQQDMFRDELINNTTAIITCNFLTCRYILFCWRICGGVFETFLGVIASTTTCEHNPSVPYARIEILVAFLFVSILSRLVVASSGVGVKSWLVMGQMFSPMSPLLSYTYQRPLYMQSTRLYIYIYIYTHARIHTYKYAQIHAYTHIYIYIYIRVYIYIYTTISI